MAKPAFKLGQATSGLEVEEQHSMISVSVWSYKGDDISYGNHTLFADDAVKLRDYLNNWIERVR